MSGGGLLFKAGCLLYLPFLPIVWVVIQDERSLEVGAWANKYDILYLVTCILFPEVFYLFISRSTVMLSNIKIALYDENLNKMHCLVLHRERMRMRSNVVDVILQ